MFLESFAERQRVLHTRKKNPLANLRSSYQLFLVEKLKKHSVLKNKKVKTTFDSTFTAV